MTAEEAIRQRIENNKLAEKLRGVHILASRELEWVLFVLKTDRMALAKRLRERCAVIQSRIYSKDKETEYWALIQDTIHELESKSEMR